ncbi:AbiTii domain-containing protein [Anaerovorax odorimutans]|uniref:AbiTii domain-containing protein n=1 Tax=Anaerovorax odorimutans TaxID=109327 RepID=UPI000408AECA|nr:hypothetical protein [Anaerovorax odorimutans]
MAGIIIELQKEALRNEADILSLLRKAYLVARKLKLTEFKDWIDNELNGYTDIKKIPDYRKIKGEVKAWNPCQGWIPVLNSSKISSRSIGDSIPNLVNVYNDKNGSPYLRFNDDDNDYLSNAIDFETQYALHVGRNQIYEILEKVRNLILDWSITLEENGIFGEELQFTKEEKQIATSTPTIYNYINNFYGNVSDTQIQQNTDRSTQE